MKELAEAIKHKAKRVAEFLAREGIEIVIVEEENHIQENFQNEGFTDGGVEKWKKRKTEDKKGRDITRYRTNRRGKRGNKTAYGRKNEGRAILTGHGTGGDKLRYSYKSSKSGNKATFTSDKAYAEIHNEGKGNMHKRKHIGAAKSKTAKINRKVKKGLDKILK
ncbi:phage morphogenesis protein [Aquimarina sp. TRL1]|uniref:phage morphogenesis protein n=1 Tax=Aquimarina sp. (strain TRL1) TaxID=2736252 RepID=UPI00158C4BC6|nr:phage morphogenesis protein [Aquimarina sp. TRL1]QKX04873.1 phage morphogenesis protein [Aquimarina sp. TRL1]